jgi:hypothetical protein
MIAIGIVAGLLALPKGWGLIALGVAFACLAAVTAGWMVTRNLQRFAMLCFWILTVLTNAVIVVSSVAPSIYFVGLLLVIWFAFFMPAIAVFGIAWASLATGNSTGRVWSPMAVWLSTILLTFMPFATVGTQWPLRLAFLATRPSLDRLADQVAAGQAVSFPRWVGPFRLAGSAVDDVSGSVGLMIDANPSGSSGFVRMSPDVPPESRGPFRWDNLLVHLGWGWEYREED